MTFAEKLKELLETASAGPTRRLIKWSDGTDAWVQDDPAEKLVDALVNAAPALVRLLEALEDKDQVVHTGCGHAEGVNPHDQPGGGHRRGLSIMALEACGQCRVDIALNELDEEAER